MTKQTKCTMLEHANRPNRNLLLQCNTGTCNDVCNIFLITSLKYRLWVLIQTADAVLTSDHNQCSVQKYEKNHNLSSENCHFYSHKIVIYCIGVLTLWA